MCANNVWEWAVVMVGKNREHYRIEKKFRTIACHGLAVKLPPSVAFLASSSNYSFDAHWLLLIPWHLLTLTSWLPRQNTLHLSSKGSFSLQHVHHWCISDAASARNLEHMRNKYLLHQEIWTIYIVRRLMHANVCDKGEIKDSRLHTLLRVVKWHHRTDFNRWTITVS
jgi:hypothetical protein